MLYEYFSIKNNVLKMSVISWMILLSVSYVISFRIGLTSPIIGKIRAVRETKMIYRDLEDLSVLSRIPGNGVAQISPAPITLDSSLLSLPFDNLVTFLEGSGRAKNFWELLRVGKDPSDDHGDGTIKKIREKIVQHCQQTGDGKLLSTAVRRLAIGLRS